MTPRKEKPEKDEPLAPVPAVEPVPVKIMPDRFPFLGLSDELWKLIITGVVTVALAWIGSEVRYSRYESNERLEKIETTGAQTHKLVNSGALVQLRLYAVAAKRIAELTQEKADIDAAKMAEDLYQEHKAKQELSDSEEKETKAKKKEARKDDTSLFQMRSDRGGQLAI